VENTILKLNKREVYMRSHRYDGNERIIFIEKNGGKVDELELNKYFGDKWNS
jgi:hypothetical protein